MSEPGTSSGSVATGDTTVSFGLGRFAFDSLGADEGKGAVETRLGRAAELFWRDRDKGKPGWRYPAQIQELQPEATIPVVIQMKGATLAGITKERGRCAVSVEQMRPHGTLLPGRARRRQARPRILEDLPEPKEDAA